MEIQMKKLFLFVIISFFLTTTSRAQSTQDGQYNFDAEAWMKAMEQMQPEMANNEMAKNMMASMLVGMKDFSVTLHGGEATVNLGQGSVAGKLEKVSESGGTTTYKMAAEGATSPDHTLIITVSGDTLMAGAGGDPSKQMPFKKAGPAPVPAQASSTSGT